MPAKPPPKKLRGTPIDLPSWWLEAAVRHTTGWSLSKLAEVLSALAGREPPWRRETVGDFLRNEFATWELMEAFCDYFDMPPAGYIARSYEEADSFRGVARRFAPSNPEKAARKAEFDKAREHLEKQLGDQTKRLESGDAEGTRSRRRPRGVVRGRSSSS